MIAVLVLFSIISVSLSVPVDHSSPGRAEGCGYDSCTQAEPGVLNVHIVPHTHDDVGWLKTVDQYYYGSRNSIQKAGVQYILDSVVKELWEDPKRRFIYVETAFFWKWWTRQSDNVKHRVHVLVRQGRLQFVGGAWSMNDEAATHYQSTIDQFTWGLSKLNETFGYCGLPRVGWQIDPFGHAREFASLLAGMGYDGLFLGRIDYQDKRTRLQGKTMEMIWRGDDDLGKPSDIFTGILYNTYSPPPGFCFDVLCSDEPIIDDPESPMYNVDRRIRDFLSFVTNQARNYRTNNAIVTMGGDFTYQDANMWYRNLDKLIEYTNLKAAKDGLQVKLFYSTPTCYLKAVKDADPVLPIKQDDFFPYASDPTAYWTGYFSSRPTTKYYEREANNYLQTVKQLQVTANLEEHNGFVLNELKSAMGVMQHHDAVTGTEKEHVTHDYERLLTQAVDDALIIAKQAFNKISLRDALQPALLTYDRCRLNESSCSTSENSSKFVVTVYNPLGWEVAAPVRVPVAEEGVYKVFGPDGKELTSQLVDIPEYVKKIPTRESKATHEVVFVDKIPGLGFKSYFVKKQDNKVKREIDLEQIRNKDYYVNVDGYWKSIKDKSLNEVKNIEELPSKEESGLYRLKQIPDRPVKYDNVVLAKENYLDAVKSNEFVNIDKVDLGILKDKNGNRDGDSLSALIKEAKRRILEASLRKKAKEDMKYPELNDDEMRMLSDDPMVVEMPDDDELIENEHIKLLLNKSTGQMTLTRNGLDSTLTFSLAYYPGCVGNNEVPANRSSGAYIFRPNSTESKNLPMNQLPTILGPVSKEMRFAGEYYATVIRLYQHADYIEHEWQVGPIPIEDGIGKEIIAKYATDIINNGEFYTDSNGRQILKRKLNKRPQWNVTLEEPIAGNYYPVTNEIYIENGDKVVSFVTDRAEGGASLSEGEVELMLHRRLLHDDAFGVGEALNETAKGEGLVVRGTHRVKFNKDQKSVLEAHLHPRIFVSDATEINFDYWLTLQNEFTALKQSLPDGLHLLTLEPLTGNKLLIRFENYIRTVVEVDVAAVFEAIKIKSIKETTLSANRWLKDYEKWSWRHEKEFSQSFNKEYGSFDAVDRAKDVEDITDDGLKISVKPKQIRTFVADYVVTN